jgi:hypothetical protein
MPVCAPVLVSGLMAEQVADTFSRADLGKPTEATESDPEASPPCGRLR